MKAKLNKIKEKVLNFLKPYKEAFENVFEEYKKLKTKNKLIANILCVMVFVSYLFTIRAMTMFLVVSCDSYLTLGLSYSLLDQVCFLGAIFYILIGVFKTYSKLIWKFVYYIWRKYAI